MGLLRGPSVNMSLEDDFQKPLLHKQDRPFLERTLGSPHSDNSRNGRADVILDIALGEDSDTGLDDNDENFEANHEETSSFDEDGHIEEDAREISASGESFGRPRTDDLHGLYSFLGEQPTLGPLPTIDPFRNHSENIDSLYEWIKTILCIPLAIVRLLLIIIITVGGVIIAKLLLLGWNEKIVPMPRWRRNIVSVTRLLARLILFCLVRLKVGLDRYHWIRRLGRPAKREVAPIVISNHVSFIDPIFFFFELFPSFVSSASHSNLPGIGMIIRPMQVINVERSSADSKKYALKEIKSRAMSNSFPHVMLFPEGTTTNGRALIFFQLGAFMPGLPVQPVVLRYPYAHFDNSWGRISILKLVWRMVSQFHNFMEVEYLPVIYPSTREKDHPTLFAKKVKRVMARALNVSATNHSYGDLILSTKVKELRNTLFSSCMVEMAKMEKLFHITTKEAGVLLEKFQALDTEYRTEELRCVWNTRWDWFHRPIHAVAHVLHPLWRDEKQYKNEELEQGIQEYFEHWAGRDVQLVRRLEDNLLLFRNKSLSFGRSTALLRDTQLQPVSWWKKYGTSAPTLKRLAIRVLSQDCSSSPCERNWSTWIFFHTKKRNRLSTTQLERLVFCHCNLCLLEHTSTSPEPRQVNVDKVDIEKVKDIPDIPKDEMDIYTMLYEEMSAPAICTRASSRRTALRGASASIQEMTIQNIAADRAIANPGKRMWLLQPLLVLSVNAGYVTEDQFLDALNLPKTPFAQQIFGFFDKEEEGSVSFREFLAGSAFILKHPSFDTLCRASFEFCDVNKQGFLSSVEVERSLRLVFPDVTSLQVQKMQKNLDMDGDGIIRWDDFRDFLKKYPELLAVFLPTASV
ncbi:hypothetical protein L7F22_038217 [Adiantum nelumboides]|nr:hypothetical protein [Adiantum nelumboides]